MSEVINWSFSVGAVGGPRLAGSDTCLVGAYDKASITLPAGTPKIDVQIQPANASGKVNVLVIAADSYDAEITFSADDGTTSFTLLGPLVLIGNGAVELLNPAPQMLSFSNATTEDVVVDILVGRDPAP